MRHLKLYEGFRNDLEILLKSYMSKIESCLQVLKDDYNFEYSHTEVNNTYHYITTEPFEYDNDFCAKLVSANKKLSEFGLKILIIECDVDDDVHIDNRSYGEDEIGLDIDELNIINKSSITKLILCIVSIEETYFELK